MRMTERDKILRVVVPMLRSDVVALMKLTHCMNRKDAVAEAVKYYISAHSP